MASLRRNHGLRAADTWTQLVVFELGAGEPEELAHVDYASGGQRSVGIERASGTLVAGDQWYRLP